VAAVDLLSLGPDDWQLFRRVRLAALAESPEAFGSRYENWVDAGPERWRARLADVPLNLVLLAEGEPVGMVSCTTVTDETAELISLWVAPRARGLGVGDEAVRRVLAWAELQGAQRLTLSVKITNDAARRLYERHGFRLVGPSPDEPDEVRMEVSLAVSRA
jgi:ribosomal protein S18 acetylase RimI-like enzyme